LKKFSQELKIESIFIFTSDLMQLWVWIKINDHTAHLFIDSDCMKNYMFSEFARKAQIFMQKKKKSYNLQNFDEIFMKYNNELINQKTQLIHLRLKHHWKKLRLDVTKQSDSDIVLRVCRNWIKFSSQQALEVLTHVESLASTLYSSAFNTQANLLRFLCFALL